MKSKLVLTMLALTVAVALVAGATMAWFTDTDNAGTATFTAGILDIEVTEGLTTFDNLFAELQGIHKMNPGDVWPEEVTIQITNTGNKNLAWFGNWSISGGETTTGAVVPNTSIPINLSQAVYIESMQMDLYEADGVTTWDVDHFIDEGVGAGTYGSAYTALANNNRFGVVGLDVWNNNNTTMVPGTNYEHAGALKPGAKAVITVQFGFHELANDDYQGDVTNDLVLGFTVLATQVRADAMKEQGINNWADDSQLGFFINTHLGSQ